MSQQQDCLNRFLPSSRQDHCENSIAQTYVEQPRINLSMPRPVEEEITGEICTSSMGFREETSYTERNLLKTRWRGALVAHSYYIVI